MPIPIKAADEIYPIDIQNLIMNYTILPEYCIKHSSNN